MTGVEKLVDSKFNPMFYLKAGINLFIYIDTKFVLYVRVYIYI